MLLLVLSFKCLTPQFLSKKTRNCGMAYVYIYTTILLRLSRFSNNLGRQARNSNITLQPEQAPQLKTKAGSARNPIS
jgi:hypothetical protein